jgi:hypothetical protein
MWGVDKENTVNVETTYCMKPIRLDVIKSNGRKMLFVVAGGNYLDENGQPQGGDPSPGVLGLVVLTPNGVALLGRTVSMKGTRVTEAILSMTTLPFRSWDQTGHMAG